MLPGPLLKSTTSTPVAPSRSTSSNTKSKRLYTKLVLSGASTVEQRHLILTSSRIHYFNNQAAIVRSIDEKNEALRAVVESVSICMRLCKFSLDCVIFSLDYFRRLFTFLKRKIENGVSIVVISVFGCFVKKTF